MKVSVIVSPSARSRPGGRIGDRLGRGIERDGALRSGRVDRLDAAGEDVGVGILVVSDQSAPEVPRSRALAKRDRIVDRDHVVVDAQDLQADQSRLAFGAGHGEIGPLVLVAIEGVSGAVVGRELEQAVLERRCR